MINTVLILLNLANAQILPIEALNQIARVETQSDLSELEKQLLQPFAGLSPEQRAAKKDEFISTKNAIFVRRQQLRLTYEIDRIQNNLKVQEQRERYAAEGKALRGRGPYARPWMREQDSRDLQSKVGLRRFFNSVAEQLKQKPSSKLWYGVEDVLQETGDLEKTGQLRDQLQPFRVQSHSKSLNGSAPSRLNQILGADSFSRSLEKELTRRNSMEALYLSLAFDSVAAAVTPDGNESADDEVRKLYDAANIDDFRAKWGQELAAAGLDINRVWGMRYRQGYDRSVYFPQPLSQDDPDRSYACGGFALAAAMEGELNKKLADGEVKGLSPWFAYATARMAEVKPNCSAQEALAFDKVFGDFYSLDQGIQDVSASMQALSAVGTCSATEMPHRGVPTQRGSTSGLYRIQKHTSLNVEQNSKCRSFSFLKALLDADMSPILAIDSERSKTFDGWKEIGAGGQFGHVVVLVGYGVGVSAFSGVEVPYLILRDSKGENPPRHYKVPAKNLLNHLTDIHLVQGVERVP